MGNSSFWGGVALQSARSLESLGMITDGYNQWYKYCSMAGIKEDNFVRRGRVGILC